MEANQVIAIFKTRIPGFTGYRDLLKYAEERLERKEFYSSEIAALFKFEFDVEPDATNAFLGALGDMGFLEWHDGKKVTSDNVDQWKKSYRMRRAR